MKKLSRKNALIHQTIKVMIRISNFQDLCDYIFTSNFLKQYFQNLIDCFHHYLLIMSLYRC